MFARQGNTVRFAEVFLSGKETHGSTFVEQGEASCGFSPMKSGYGSVHKEHEAFLGSVHCVPVSEILAGITICVCASQAHLSIV